MADNKTTLSAVVTVKDEATTNLKTIGDALKQAGATEEQVNDKIAKSQLAVEMAQKGRLTSSQQLGFAIQAEAAKGNELATELVSLERDYAILARQMKVMADYGKEIPQSMISQASAAKQAAQSIREQQAAAEASSKTFEKFKIGGLSVMAVALASKTAKEALSGLADQFITSVKNIEDLGGEVTASDKALASLKRTLQDPEFEKMNFLSKGMALAFSAVNTSLAETDAEMAKAIKLQREYNADKRAAMAVVDEETAKLKEGEANRDRVRASLASFAAKEKAHASEVREAKKKALEQETADFQREIKAWEDAEQAFFDRRKKEQAAQIGSMSKAFKAQSDYYSKRADLSEKEGKSADAEAAKEESRSEAQRQIGINTARAVADAWTEAGIAMANGSKSGGDAAKMAAFASARAAIQAAAGEGAAKAIAAHSGIPFVGVAIGLAVAGAVATMILAYMTKFHSGGVVGAGDGSRLPGMASDERAITVRVGERVQTQDQQRSQSHGGVVVNLNSRTMFAPSSAETKRQVRDVMRVAKRGR